LKILVTFAVEAEFAPWRRLRNLRETRRGAFAVFQTQIGRASVDFVVTGMGLESGRRGAEAVMSAPYDFCIASGFAGALKSDYAVGDVIVARSVQQLGVPKTLESARALANRAEQAGARSADMLLTVDHVVGTHEERAQLAPFASVVDMESFAVLSAARDRRIPAVAIRAISDSFDEEMPAGIHSMLDEKGRVDVVGVAKFVATRPSAVPAVIRLGRNSKAAAAALAHFLESFIENISSSPDGWLAEDFQEVAAR